MRLTGNWLLVHRLVTTALYKLLRLVFITVQRIYWQLNGTAQKLRQARLPHNYQRSAQVLDVLLCHVFTRGQTATIEDFLCTFNRFEDPLYIIYNENITLLTINEHDVVFCETKEKGRHEVTTAGTLLGLRRIIMRRLIIQGMENCTTWKIADKIARL